MPISTEPTPKRKRGQKKDHEASRARVRERTREIAERMSRLEWRPRMAEELAKKWGVAKTTVQHYAAEASRLVQDAIADGPEFRAGLQETVLSTAQEARDRKDFRAALSGYRLLAEIGGHLAPTKSKHEITGKDGAPVPVVAQVIEVVELPPLKPL